ncbi:MAG: hypothetical protein FWH08_01655 [Oscillospiraceae bacterium]|nr:hypothetical protein [Oscillospiraceae bacterium]
MKKLKDIKSISALLNNEKAVKLIVAVGFAVIALILLSDLFSWSEKYDKHEKSTESALTLDAASYTEQLEIQLCDIISQIRGVGRVKVMVTLENLDETVPRVRGAAVVCEGGDDIFIKQKVVETVSKVLGISTARVSVTY